MNVHCAATKANLHLFWGEGGDNLENNSIIWTLNPCVIENILIKLTSLWDIHRLLNGCRRLLCVVGFVGECPEHLFVRCVPAAVWRSPIRPWRPLGGAVSGSYFWACSPPHLNIEYLNKTPSIINHKRSSLKKLQFHYHLNFTWLIGRVRALIILHDLASHKVEIYRTFFNAHLCHFKTSVFDGKM